MIAAARGGRWHLVGKQTDKFGRMRISGLNAGSVISS
jgi:hypothetical protein